MSDRQLTSRIAALVFLIVLAIYFWTMAPTTSFWDCGEFIACSFILGVPHPPGSPLFIMLGRLFSLVPFEGMLKAVGLMPDFADYAVRVTIMSPVAGALSAVFCYLIILRLIRGWQGPLSKTKERWSDHLGAVVGTFIFALADSNWFNAVEAEVYAYAIFLMMLALWLGLVWADTVGKPIHLSLLLFLVYLMGLSSGMHLLCLLVLPSIALLGLFSYVENRRDAWVLLGAATLLVLGGYFALHFQNATRLMAESYPESAYTYGIVPSPDAQNLVPNPVGPGVIEYRRDLEPEFQAMYQQRSAVLMILFGVAGIVLTFLTKTISWRDTWTGIFVAAASVATIRLLTGLFFWYEGVGEFPMTMLVGGIIAGAALGLLAQGRRKPSFSAFKGYHLGVALLLLVVVGYSTYLVLLIRSGLNPAIDENNPENWANLFSFLARKQYGNEEMSLIIFNRRATLQYQLWDMFVKYLLHQFPASITGALFNWKLTFRSAMEVEYFGMRVPDLPLILLFLGLLWHFEADNKRFLALVVLWTISGLGLVVYLNMPDPQPRERHYVFTGATSVMAIWMGMGVTGLIRMIPEWLPKNWPEKLRTRAAPYAMAAVGLAVPVWFLVGYPLVDEYSGDFSVRYSNWAKHDRSYDTVGYDYAYNILASCEPNAVLFTNGDNDTFPLWYVQEVVGFRKDVRIVNLSLLNTDWYIQQFRLGRATLPMPDRYSDEWIRDVLCGANLETLTKSGRIDALAVSTFQTPRDERGSAGPTVSDSELVDMGLYGDNIRMTGDGFVVDRQNRPIGSVYDKDRRLVGWRPKTVRAGKVDSIIATLNDGRFVAGTISAQNVQHITVGIEDRNVWETVPTSQVTFLSTGKLDTVYAQLNDGRIRRGVLDRSRPGTVRIRAVGKQEWEEYLESQIASQVVGQVDTVYAEREDGAVVRGFLRLPQRERMVIEHGGSVPADTVDVGDIRSYTTYTTFPGITWEMTSSPDYPVLRVQDVMVKNLVDWVKWERPVYFAVTVAPDNLIGLDPYLRMEGMVLRVVSEPDEAVIAGRGQYGLNAERSQYNLDHSYQIRNMTDVSIYKDDNMLKLISNYRSAYLRLAEKQIEMGKVDSARVTLEKFNERIPLDWRGAYHGVTVARRGGPVLADLGRHYAFAASRILRQEIPTIHIFDRYTLERVRVTASLLRYSGEEDEAANVLLFAEPYARRPSPYSGINQADYVSLLSEASLNLQQVGKLTQAREVLARCHSALMSIPATAQVNAEFRRLFRTDKQTFAAQVAGQIAHLDDMIAAQVDTSIPPLPAPGPSGE